MQVICDALPQSVWPITATENGRDGRRSDSHRKASTSWRIDPWHAVRDHKQRAPRDATCPCNACGIGKQKTDLNIYTARGHVRPARMADMLGGGVESIGTPIQSECRWPIWACTTHPPAIPGKHRVPREPRADDVSTRVSDCLP
jgi:hypothetical protein